MRYSKLVGLVLSVAVIAAPAWAWSEPAVLPTTFVNNTGVTPAYFTIIGQNPNDLTDSRWHRVTATGQLVPMMASDGVKDPNSPALANCDYNIPFTAKGAPPFPLPLVRAGRIYVSLGDKLVTQVTIAGNNWVRSWALDPASRPPSARRREALWFRGSALEGR